ncbi:glutaredoxin 2 [Vibrio ponticus]|nr:glutaredoxin 2 [Vibrio ponticus]
MMKLYVFDSCPYCVRVKTLIGLKQLNVELKPFALGELPKQVADKLTHFTVPILEYTNSESGTELMTKSLDILQRLDSLSQPYLASYQLSSQLEQILAQLKPLTAQLCYPRMLHLNLPELATESAVTMFTQSRQEMFGTSLDQLLAQTSTYLPALEQALSEISQQLDLASVANQSRALTIDDIALFAELRNLTMIGELTMPSSITAYLLTISRLSSVALYTPIFSQ